MNHFYVTLPSDSSIKYYPNNTVAHFTTKLPHRIRLDGDYEVGLAEFIYPHSWFNFSKGLSAHFKNTFTDVKKLKKLKTNISKAPSMTPSPLRRPR